MSLGDLQAEAASWKAWERGYGPEPEMRPDQPKREAAIYCECGARFTFRQGFDAWNRHDCEYRRQEP